jgi:hypothetical protein
MAKATKQRIRHPEPMSLMAAAYADAVRDILASDGQFHLAGRARDDGGWAWDGVRWTRVEHADPRARVEANLSPPRPSTTWQLPADLR